MKTLLRRTAAKDENKAYVRCVGKNKGISICNPGPKICGQKNTAHPKMCTKQFVAGLKHFSKGRWKFSAGKKCKGACMSEDGEDFVTFSQAKEICENLGMRLPKTSADFNWVRGTGCNLNRKNIWYDL